MPPGYPAPPPYAQPRPGPPAWLASPRGLARAAVVLLGVCALADAFSVVANCNLFSVSDRLADDVLSLEEGEADRADLLVAVAGFLQSLALLATAVVFIVWFRRVRINAEVFRPDGHRMRRGWAVWGWLTPVVNLWFPKRMADDVWAASLPYAPDGSPLRVSRAVMNWWWGLWIATLFLGRGTSRMYLMAETPEEIRAAAVAMTVSDAVDVLAAVAAALFVRRLTALQDEKAHQGPVLPAPSPAFG
ncbi:hypothetical protein AC230_05410 [Streptomyces caatingaensis]|uniref:DUF4328 domain-containing protein n=1 Tax=Streptomyces caatingaensis TaxID=1678637 RepID=A0A0K9XM13_9ACTN|nr:hypothetical protein AC230_05410 [Streptomyces caatingaensis]